MPIQQQRKRLFNNDYDDDELTIFQRWKRDWRNFSLWRNVKNHPWRYGIGFVLMVGAIALFAIPGFAPAIGIGSTLSYITVATALKLGISFVGAQALLGTAAGLVALFAPVIAGYALKFLGAAIQIGLRALLTLLGMIIGAAFIVTSLLAMIGTIAAVALSAVIALGTSAFTSALGNFFSGKYFAPTNILAPQLFDKHEETIRQAEKDAAEKHQRRGFLGKLLAGASTLFIGLPLRILANVMDAVTIATAATAVVGLILSVIALGIAAIVLAIPLLIVSAVALAVEYAAYKLIDYTGRLLYGLGRFCLGEGFHFEQVSWAAKMDKRIPNMPTRQNAQAMIANVRQNGLANAMQSLGKGAGNGEGFDLGSYSSPLESNSSSSSSPTRYFNGTGRVTVTEPDSDDNSNTNSSAPANSQFKLDPFTTNY